MTFSDKTLICRECREAFLFSAGEQEFFAQKNLVNEPRRCPNCRIKVRAQAAGRESSEVNCAECGAMTRVPFKPSGVRPVLCPDCLRKTRRDPEEQN